MQSIMLTFASAGIILLLFILYYSKTATSNNETKLYSISLVTSFLLCVVDMAIYFTTLLEVNPTIINIIGKIHLILLMALVLLIYVYTIFIQDFEDKKKKPIVIITLAIGIIGAIILFATKLTIKDFTMSGLSYNLMQAINLVYFVLILIFVARLYVKNKKNLNKSIAFIILIILYTTSLFLHNATAMLFAYNFFFTFTLLIMYFTIENPDIQVLTELQTAKEEAERANKAKTDFLSRMSHDVRTPLNAIVGFAATLEDCETLEEAKENSKYIVMASKNVLELVNGILDISKIEANKVEINNVEYSLTKECEEIIKMVSPRIDSTDVLFKHTIARDIPKTLLGDRVKVRDIITNLLNNAIKYTKEGYIELNVSCINQDDTSSLVISVEDSGTGISQKSVDNLFNQYSSNDMSDEGTGLGLSITKNLVEMLGGKIIVQTAQGAGSKFVVYLNQQIVQKIEVEEEVVEIIEDDSNVLDLSGKKILIVDDNNLNLKVAVNFIKDYNAEIDTCTSGSECVSMINEGRVYDIIFMDDMMPNQSGTETLHILQKNPSFDQKVIVLTANSVEGMRDKYLEEGFKDYLSKPIIKLELERILRKHLNNEARRVIFNHDDKSNNNYQN